LRYKWKLINLQIVGKNNGQEKSNNDLVLAMQPQLIILEVIFHTRRKTQGRRGLSNGFGLVHYQSLYAQFLLWKTLGQGEWFCIKALVQCFQIESRQSKKPLLIWWLKQWKKLWVKTHSKEPQKVLDVNFYHKKLEIFFFGPFETMVVMTHYSFLTHMNVMKLKLKIHLIHF